MVFREAPERQCPGCGTTVRDDTVRCGTCGYGLRPDLDTSDPRPRHRTLFSSEEPPPAAYRLAREYRCSHCRSFGARVHMLGSVAGTGAVATCRYCGAKQAFDLEIFEGCRGVRWELFDVD